ncbi:MAG: rod shape-determining protein MreC [Lachnospiraceae bacterium]|nr:rod shape-determining protein MreC [Lachnospiraceae bacterium]
MSNRYSKIMLIVITIFCVFFMAITYIDSSLLDPVRVYANYFLVPIQRNVSHFGNAAAAEIRENRHLHEVYAENQELMKRIDELVAENNRLRSDSLELERLRELYKLDQNYRDYPTVAARVISRDSQKWFNIFRVDKGLADGITKDMNVIGGGGLIGIVVDVGANYATVRSIIDDESNVYAMSQYSNDTCLVKGNIEAYETGALNISNIDKNAVFNDGDAVITSNLSTKYLPGILIGYASDININSQHLTKSGRLIPVADFSDIQEVLIITQIKTESGIVQPDSE